MRRCVPRALACGLAVVALSGCPSSTTTRTGSTTPTRPAATASACPQGAPPTPAQWPAAVPDDLPKPAGAVIEKVEPLANGVTVVRFSTESSLREGVLYIVKEFPAAGYTLGRGDAEVTEADAPFEKGPVRGLVRMLAQEQCRTLWLLAVTRQGGGAVPFAPNYSPPASSSPLPFG